MRRTGRRIPGEARARRARGRTGLDTRLHPGEDDPAFDQLKGNSVKMRSRCAKSRMEAFRERLLARGKRPKVILTAVARKLLVIANAVIRAGQPWDSQLALTR
jgi:transposase